MKSWLYDILFVGKTVLLYQNVLIVKGGNINSECPLLKFFCIIYLGVNNFSFESFNNNRIYE